MNNDRSDNVADMAHDVGKALLGAGVVIVSIIFCAGVTVGALLTGGLS